MNMNRLHNVSNPYQGKFKKVLCVCSAGLLRSPTMALVLSQEPYNCNTRSVGTDEEFALIPVETGLLFWADVIVCATSEQAEKVHKLLGGVIDKPVYSLDIEDNYRYRDPELIELIKKNWENLERPECRVLAKH